MVPYDVQLVGAIALHRGTVAEMATGEGKTLVATMPLYLNALAGRGAHLVTVNSYLAHSVTPSGWAPCSAISGSPSTSSTSTIRAHRSGGRPTAADITYGTNNEFGFDYLRDNMVHQLAQRVQRESRVRDHRRGGLDPHRRGSYAADHLGSGGTGHVDALQAVQLRSWRTSTRSR